MTRGGRKNSDEDTTRRCIATGASLPKAELVRFVIGPSSEVVPDVAGKLPGRGIWVSADRAALELATSKNLFSRSAKKPVKVSANLPDEVEALIVRQIVQLIALSRKSGQAITGFEKVKQAAQDRTVAVLLQASNGSEAQKSKIRPPTGEKSYISCLSGQELGLAFGRENVIHAALAAGGLDKRIVEEAARLAGIRRNQVS